MTQYVDDDFLARRYDISQRSVWRWTAKGLLPKPVKLTKSCTRWRLDEIEARDAKIEAARESAAA